MPVTDRLCEKGEKGNSMSKQFIMGNEAMGLAAIAAGVRSVSGYPGTPSTEVLETVAKNNPGNIYVEWSVNEKAALEVAAGASYAGARALVTMKQVGLNVATDPLMSLSYIGVKGGLVLIVADDPGPISSQTEQDTRTFGLYSKVPVLDPSSPEEAYRMVGEAFRLSEEFHTPVIVRPTTRIDHGCAVVDVKKQPKRKPIPGFEKDPQKWVIFPGLSRANHRKIFENRIPELSERFSDSDLNPVSGKGRLGILTDGISHSYVMDVLNGCMDVKVMKLGTAFPFPDKAVRKFLKGLTDVLVLEELDPYMEEQLFRLSGMYGIRVRIHGKHSGEVFSAGENTLELTGEILRKYLGKTTAKKLLQTSAPKESTLAPVPDLPVRPPVLCAGCSHRASFYAVKTAMKGREAVFTGDIGCYTLGNAKPLDMVDTCLCMGADITIAQGLMHMEPDKKYFAFIGDSTFFASGITGIVNAFYNQADLTVCVLDNSTTAMTGHQPHPGTGRTMMGKEVQPVSIEKVLKGIGIETVVTVDPMEHDQAVLAVKKVSEEPGVKALIFRHPCIALVKKPATVQTVDAGKCVGCLKCIRGIGCPAISVSDKKAKIDPGLCTDCGLCTYLCPVSAIGHGKEGSV